MDISSEEMDESSEEIEGSSDDMQDDETHPLIQCIQNNNQEKLHKLLLECDINGLYSYEDGIEKISPLMAAVKFHQENILEFLLEQGADPNIISNQNMTALHYVSKHKAPLIFAERLLESKADPNIPSLLDYTALHSAAECDRDDVMELLISAGAIITLLRLHEFNKKLSEKIHKMASEVNELCTEVRPFMDLDMDIRDNKDINIETIDMMKEHPQLHILMLELYMERFPELGIKWLKDTNNVHSYIDSFIRRFPQIHTSVVEITINSLYRVCCIMDTIPQEQTEALIPHLLQCLKERRDLCETVIKTLFEVTQKTDDGLTWDFDLPEKICETIDPFGEEHYSLEIRAYTYGVYANVQQLEEYSDTVSEWIPSVPLEVLTFANKQKNDKLKQRLKKLSDSLDNYLHLVETSHSENELFPDKSEAVKKKMKKKESPMKNQSSVASVSQTQSSLDETNERRWNQISLKWREKLKKLHSAEQSALTKIGSIVYINKRKFRIAKGSDGTEVFLGLRDDGTEVAIKRVTRSNCNVLINEVKCLLLPGLDHPNIVRYIDFTEDENFSYLALQLCERTLKKVVQKLSDQRKKIVKQFLKGLKVLHTQTPPILHRDIKPQNVLIDVRGRARLADFGLSRRLAEDQTTYMTQCAGTECWMAKEILVKQKKFKRKKNRKIRHKCSTDIQVAGMLVYYILSGGKHPFDLGLDFEIEENICCGKYNLDRVNDVVAKDLIERMIDGDPKKRPTAEECLSHPFFWEKQKRLDYLTKIGNRKEIVKCYEADADLVSAFEECDVKESLKNWKTEFPEKLVCDMEEKRGGNKKKENQGYSYPEHALGLLRFIRNLHQHPPEEAAEVDVMTLFPELFGCIYKSAEKLGWNSEPPLKEMFQRKNWATE